MALQLQPQTEITARNDGSVVYIGEWAEALTILRGFAVSLTGDTGSFVAFTPGVILAAAPSPTTATDWAATETTLSAAGHLLVTNARLRALPGGLGQLTLELSAPKHIKEKITDALADALDLPTDQGERSYSFSVSEIPRSILEDEAIETQSRITSWLAAPSALKSRFLYVNPTTDRNAQLTGYEQAIATKILLGQSTTYTYVPTVTLTITKARIAPEGLPGLGSDSSPPAGSVSIPDGANSSKWRVISSGGAQNSDGTWSGSVTWLGQED